MKQQDFEEKNQSKWNVLETCLKTTSSAKNQEFPALYSSLCQHLALAKSRRYSPQLIDKLNGLALRCYHQLYQHQSSDNSGFIEFLIWRFPDAIRRNYRYIFLATVLFAVPLLVMGTACYLNEELIYSLVSPGEVRSFESMYDPANEKMGRERKADTDFMMLGFYIKHNVGISFRVFAGGLFFGVGTIFSLVFNGLSIGGVAGHLTQLGYTQTFYPFVASHGAFELTAIVFSGAAGLKLGYALINPGRYTRISALQIAGRDAVLIVYGATLMLLFAAFLEAFWSSSSVLPNWIKYTVGSLFWILVGSYCCLSGRRHES